MGTSRPGAQPGLFDVSEVSQGAALTGGVDADEDTVVWLGLEGRARSVGGKRNQGSGCSNLFRP